MKGAEEESAGAKQEALDEWIGVVNADSRYGIWANSGLARNVADLKDVIAVALSGRRLSEIASSGVQI